MQHLHQKILTILHSSWKARKQRIRNLNNSCHERIGLLREKTNKTEYKLILRRPFIFLCSIRLQAYNEF